MSTTVSYKGNTIATINHGNSATLTTQGTWVEGNITVSAGALNLQSKTVNPTASAQTITADNGYDGLSSVSVAAVKEHIATITSTGHSTRCNVEYDSTVYYQSGNSFTFNSGETLLIDAGGSRGGGSIYVNNTFITGSQDNITNYNYTLPNCNITIEFDYGSGGIVRITEDSTGIVLQSKTVSPTESQQTISADSGYDGLSTVTVNAISNTYVGSGITRQNSLSVNGRTVTANAGYYSSNTTATIPYASVGADVAITTLPISVNSSGLVSVNYSNHDGDFEVRASSAGYVNAGVNLGGVGVDISGSLQLTTQAAKTVTPTTSSQTAVAAGRYTTGVVTVAAIPSNYVDSSTLKTYYTGSSAPSSSLGANGDLYFQSTGA